MNTQDLKGTAAAAYILIQAMKSILEQEGYELDTAVFSLHADLADGDTYQGSEYRLGEEIEKVIHQLQVIGAMETYVLAPKEPTDEMLESGSVIIQGLLGSPYPYRRKAEEIYMDMIAQLQEQA